MEGCPPQHTVLSCISKVPTAFVGFFPATLSNGEANEESYHGNEGFDEKDQQREEKSEARWQEWKRPRAAVIRGHKQKTYAGLKKEWPYQEQDRQHCDKQILGQGQKK